MADNGDRAWLALGTGRAGCRPLELGAFSSWMVADED